MSLSLTLASGNSHKAEEFAELFDPKLVVIESASQKIDVVEDGNSFHQNALLKAKAFYDYFKTPVLSDDSGLCVKALPEELGIHSARFGGDGLNDRDRAVLLLEKMADQSQRSAYFVCVLCLYLSPEEIFYFEGRMDGSIGVEYKGEHGFGYDPVFIPDHHEGDLSVAELPDWKFKNSHRAQACKFAQSFLRERVCQNHQS